MPTLVPSVTKDPRVRFPSTWRDAIGKPLTDSQIRQYAREGFYGSDEKAKQEARDKARIVEGTLMLARPCESCKDNKTLGSFMRFSYLPKSGYYCDHCRSTFKNEKEQERKARLRYWDADTFE